MIRNHAASIGLAVVGAIGLTALVGITVRRAAPAELWEQVEIIRTEGGVPHIRAENLRAAGYALAWLQSEDYGPRTALGILRARGTMGLVFGRDSMASDFLARFEQERAAASLERLRPETREIYEGFAAGLNRYITLHRGEFVEQMPADFSAADVLAGDINGPAWNAGRAFAQKEIARSTGTRGGTTRRARTASRTTIDATRRAVPADADAVALASDNVGSNAWAFAPSRTKSGRAILLRNPHLTWTAGYYEAHVTIPDLLDFYGDFRIGGPFAVIGGFNRYLGWSTTNNAQSLSEIYELALDPSTPDRYLFDGASLPIERREVAVRFRTANGLGTETREYFFTPIGPVVHRTATKLFVVKTAAEWEFRTGDQFVGMMRARSLAEWRDAMRIRARATSNFTYADRAGNILLFWNATLPFLPHPSGGDSVATPAASARDIWTRYVPFDSLPQILNPRGGYVHNENSSVHFTDFSSPIDTLNRYPNFERPSFSLRSQLALQLVSDTAHLDLAEVVRRKHVYRMLLADRVKPDLLRALAAAAPSAELSAAKRILEGWDNTAAPEATGAVLFELWWGRYGQGLADSLRYATPWRASDPARTPVGLADASRAVEAMRWAVSEATRRHGRPDIPWGEIHRVRRGDVDVPVGGCSGALGCFRVLNFEREPDGRLAANGGDGWVLAVEFTDIPTAYSVLAYGESNRPESPWYATQAAQFARGELKPVRFTRAAVDSAAIVRYRPGAEPPAP